MQAYIKRAQNLASHDMTANESKLFFMLLFYILQYIRIC